MRTTNLDGAFYTPKPMNRLALFLGIAIILFGAIANPWVFGYFLTVDGSLDSERVRWAIILFQFFCIASGIYLAYNQPNIVLGDLLLSLGSTLFTLVIVAVLLQFFYQPKPVVSGWFSFTKPTENNDFSSRGRAIQIADDDFVIVLVGDSQVECESCAFDYIPEIRLEKHLNDLGKKTKVISLGASGYGQDQQLLMLEDYFNHNHRADLVLVWETPANDIWNNMFPTHWPTNANPKPTFWLEDGVLQGPTAQIGEVLPEPKIKIVSLIKDLLPATSERKRLRDDEWEVKLPAPYQPTTSFTGPANDIWQKCWDENVRFFRSENLDIEKSHLAFNLTPASPRMEYGLQLSNLLLKEMQKKVEEQGGSLMTFRVATPQPKEVKEKETYVFNDKYYHTSQEQFYENIDRWNADLTHFEIAITNETWKVHVYDNIHLNEHANDEAMKVLADSISSFIPNVEF